MKKILLDLNPAGSVDWIHEYLKFKLEFEDYYGCNLDALYDELTEITEDTCIGVFYPAKGESSMSLYLDRVKKVMRDAEKDNSHLCIIFGDMEDNYEENII